MYVEDYKLVWLEENVGVRNVNVEELKSESDATIKLIVDIYGT